MAPVYRAGAHIAVGSQPAAAAGGGGGPTDADSFDLALAAARLSGADGDSFRDTSTGQIWIFWKPTGTPGFLVPGEFAGKLTLVTGAAGQCYMTMDDTLYWDPTIEDDEDPPNVVGGWAGTMPARGWKGGVTTHSVVEKAAGSPLTINHPTLASGWSSGNAYWPNDGAVYFDSSKRYLMIQKYQVVSASNYITHQYCELRTTSPNGFRMRWSTGNTNTNEGYCQWIDGSATRGVSGFTASTDPRWMIITTGTYGSSGLANDACTVRVAQDPIMTATCKIGTAWDLETWTGSSVVMPAYSGSNVGGDWEVKLYEFVCAEVSA